MRKKLANKLLLFSAAALIVVGSLAVMSLVELTAWERAAERFARESQQAALDGMFHAALTRAVGEAVSYAVVGNEEYRKEAIDALQTAESAMARLRQTANGSATDPAEPIRALRQEQESLLAGVREAVRDTLRAPTGQVPKAELLERLYAPEEDADRVWDAALAWHDGERRATLQTLREHRERLMWAALTRAAAVLLWIAGIMIFAVKAVGAPLQRLSDAVERAAAGDLDQQIVVTRGDEIGRLQASFKRMTDELRAQRAALFSQIEESKRMVELLAEARAAGSPDRPTPGSLAGTRALLADSNEDECALVAVMLEHSGVRVTRAASGSEAAEALRGGRFDFVVEDASLAQADELRAVLSAQDGTGVAPASIVLSAPEGTEEWTRSQAIGADRRVARPVSFYDLHAALSGLARPKSAQDS
jgi:CheY-like chemotaxis protein